MGKIDIDQDEVRKELYGFWAKVRATILVHKYCIIGGIVLFILGLMI